MHYIYDKKSELNVKRMWKIRNSFIADTLPDNSKVTMTISKIQSVPSNNSLKPPG